MAGFGDRLNAMKSAQEAANLKKQEEAAEKSRQESEAKMDALAKRRESVAGELTIAEEDAAGANEVLQETGEGLEGEFKTQLEEMKAEALAALQKFEALKAELAQIDAEMVEAPAELIVDEIVVSETTPAAPEKEFDPDNASVKEVIDAINEKFSSEAEKQLEIRMDQLAVDLEHVDAFKPAPSHIVERTREMMSVLATSRSELLKLGAALAEKSSAAHKGSGGSEYALSVDKIAPAIIKKLMEVNSHIEWMSRKAQKLNGASNVPKSQEVENAALARTATGEDVANFLHIAEVDAKARGAKTDQEIMERSLASLDWNMLGNRPGGHSAAADLGESAVAFLKQKRKGVESNPNMKSEAATLKGIIERAEKHQDLNKRF